MSGAGKRDRVLPLVLAEAEQEREETRATQEILDAGRWVYVPREITVPHSQAGALGAVWDKNVRRYALPSEDSREQLQRIVDTLAAEATQAQERTAADRAGAEYREIVLMASKQQMIERCWSGSTTTSPLIILTES